MSTTEQHFISVKRCTIVSYALLSAFLVGCDSASTGAPPFQVITPIEGSWTSAAGETLSFNGKNLGFNDGELRDEPFPISFEITGDIFEPIDLCNSTSADTSRVEFEGTINNGEMTLYVVGTDKSEVCVHGTFTDMVTISIDANDARKDSSYENDRIEVVLHQGLWESEGADTVSLFFFDLFSVDNDDSEDVFGCDLTADATNINFDGIIKGFDTTTRTNPTIAQLVAPADGTVMYSNVVLKDRDTMTIQDATGKSHTLKRSPPIDLPAADLPAGCSSDRN